jgi:hypothetical protein
MGPSGEHPDVAYDLDTARATLDACAWDLASEEGRTAALDGKLTQLAGFSGVSISISAAVSGAALVGGKLPHGFAIALGGCVVAAAALLLGGVVSAFAALSPKRYVGVEAAEVAARTTPSALRREPAEALALFAASRRDMLERARGINDQKAAATVRTFRLVGGGFAALVLAIAVTAVGSVV